MCGLRPRSRSVSRSRISRPRARFRYVALVFSRVGANPHPNPYDNPVRVGAHGCRHHEPHGGELHHGQRSRSVGSGGIALANHPAEGCAATSLARGAAHTARCGLVLERRSSCQSVAHVATRFVAHQLSLHARWLTESVPTRPRETDRLEFEWQHAEELRALVAHSTPQKALEAMALAYRYGVRVLIGSEYKIAILPIVSLTHHQEVTVCSRWPSHPHSHSLAHSRLHR